MITYSLLKHLKEIYLYSILVNNEGHKQVLKREVINNFYIHEYSNDQRI